MLTSARVRFTPDTKIPNAGTFIIMREDHTLGNLLRMRAPTSAHPLLLLISHRQLLRDPRVLFAGYRAPHPLEYSIEVKVQTTEQSDPQQVLLAAMEALQRELGAIEKSFTDELKKYNPTR